MPKPKNGVNRSQAIRDILAVNPKTPSNEIISTLAAKGIKVSHTLIYFVRGHMKNAKRKKMRQRVAQAVPSTNGNPIELIRRVKGLAADVGGINKLKQLVEMLAE